MLLAWMLISLLLGALPLGEWVLRFWPGGRPAPVGLADRLWRVGLEGSLLAAGLPALQGWLAAWGALRWDAGTGLAALAGGLAVMGAVRGPGSGQGRPGRCLAAAWGAAAGFCWPAAQGTLAVWLGALVVTRRMGPARRLAALSIPAWLAAAGAGWQGAAFGLWAAGSVLYGRGGEFRREHPAGLTFPVEAP